MKLIFKIIIYFIFNFNIIFKLIKINFFPFGYDVSKVLIKKKKIIKTYINQKKLKNTLSNYEKLKKFYFIPKLLKINNNDLIFEFKGDLLNLYNNIPANYIYQLMNIFYILANNNILINDLNPWVLNNNIINNFTVIDDKIYIVDFGKISFESRELILKKYHRLLIDIIKIKNKIY